MPKAVLEKHENFYELILSDPPLNILDLAMLDEMMGAIAEVREDRHALLITAAGEKAFSAGASVQDHLGDRVAVMLEKFHGFFRTLHRMNLVTVALVQGVALGGGCELALGCDFVLASERARFGQPEINLGVFPPVAAWQLSRQVPPRRGLELLLLGQPVDAATAHSLGMVNAVLPADGFRGHADTWLAPLFRQSASSIRMARRAFRLASADDFEAKLASVEKLYLEELMKTHDAVEGLAAFLEKRAPVFRGD